MIETPHAIPFGDATLDARAIVPDDARALYVFAHGAGAGMDHAFLVRAAHALAARGIATLRYDFPYRSAGSRRPDPRPTLVRAVRAATAWAHETHPTLPCVAGGKSMGGRMTSLAHAEAPLEGIGGIAFYGFPLHPAGKPGTERADHLAAIDAPMLFLQGTRDKLAPLDALTPIVERLPRATLHVVDGADHGFAVLKRSGRTDDDVHEELADTTAAWIRRLA